MEEGEIIEVKYESSCWRTLNASLRNQYFGANAVLFSIHQGAMEWSSMRKCVFGRDVSGQGLGYGFT